MDIITLALAKGYTRKSIIGISGGQAPYIGDNGNWYIWDVDAQAFYDSGKPSSGTGGSGNASIFQFEYVSEFPTTGDANCIYISTNTSFAYYWYDNQYNILGRILPGSVLDGGDADLSDQYIPILRG